MTIRINAQLCTGCRICELICSFTKEGEFNPQRARIRVVKMERVLIDIPVVCRQCPDAPCVAACPADALQKVADNSISVDDGLCTGCGSCTEACSFAAISVDPLRETAFVCDLCQGDPQCVKWCPTGALTCGGPEQTREEIGQEGTIATSRLLLGTWGISWEEYEKNQGSAQK